jgi:hypothetical protein
MKHFYTDYLYLLALSLSLSACYPVDEKAPDCYPQQGCEEGLICQAGKCVFPPLVKLDIKTQCITSSSCQTNLLQIGMNTPNYCLFLEQPSTNQALESSIHRTWLSLSQAQIINQDQEAISVEVPLTQAELRASLYALSTDCPNDQTQANVFGIPDQCLATKGCLFRLRTEQIKVDGTNAVLDFSQESGACQELRWYISEDKIPSETCDQSDNDCDGFVDESLAICE